MSNYFPLPVPRLPFIWVCVVKTLLNLSAFMQGLRPFWLLYIE
jgi:hypothetical protein